MATPAELLSTKNGEKMPKIKKNPEDKEVQDVGGPEKDWSTADYAKFKFDATAGVKPDTTILPNARVKAEKMPVIKEEEEDDESLSDPEGDAKGEEKPKKSHHKKKDPEEGEESEEELGEEDEPEAEAEEPPKKSHHKKESDDEEMTDDDLDIEDDGDLEGEDDEPMPTDDKGDMDISVKDLTDGDTKLDSLGSDITEPEDEELVHVDIDDHFNKNHGGEPGAFEPEEEALLTSQAGGADEMFPDDDKLDNTDAYSDIGDEYLGPEKMPELGFVEPKTEFETEADAIEPDPEDDTFAGDVEDDDELVKKYEAEGCVGKPKDIKEAKKKFELFRKKAKSVKEGKIHISFKVAEGKKLFEGNTVLTEEDKRQSRVLFESAVRVAAKTVAKQLHEAYQARYVQVKKLNEARVAKQMDRYLAYVVEQWVKENRVALRAQLRNKLTENLLSGLKNLFLEHWIEVPKSKVNVVEALAKNVKSLKAKLQESENQAVALHREKKEVVSRERKALVREHRARLIAEAASAVIAVDRGKFAARADTLRFSDSKSFRKDLIALREQYFEAKKTGGRSSDVPNAVPLFEEKLRRQGTTTAVDAYSDALDKLSGQ